MNPSICRTMSTICFQAGILSILLSIWLWWFLGGLNGDDPMAKAHAERFGIFVGLWAPTLLILSNRFDRYADKAKPLPGLEETPEQGDAS
jgi:hypothetical protein